jgi:hypothetical protein
MFDPINARFASSCSKNGINDAAIEAIWLGATSIKLMLFRIFHREITFQTCLDTIAAEIYHRLSDISVCLCNRFFLLLQRSSKLARFHVHFSTITDYGMEFQ